MMSPSNVRVLVAEDEFLVCKAVLRAVEQMGHTLVGTATDGEKAVEMTCQLRPDVVLMDIKMPRLDGLAASAKIQSRCPTPVVVLTAHESEELLSSAAQYGVTAYLAKPPDVSDMNRAITMALARHRDLMESRRLARELKEQKANLERALAEVRTLRGIVPICANCKQVRDDDGFWRQVEAYVEAHSDARFSHGLCPACAERLYSSESWYDNTQL